ncbi:hypothetical protein BHM03_00035083 [Ensete ventricosum]|nr:hypothetical protein BHM03_00035083 [Ensete ventricosum]
MHPSRFPNSGIRAKSAGAVALRGDACRHDELWPIAGAAAAGSMAPATGLAVGHPQGAAASRGDDTDRRGGRPLAGRLSAGKGSHRLCRGSDDDDTEGARGKLGFPFVKRTTLPTEFGKFQGLSLYSKF